MAAKWELEAERLLFGSEKACLAELEKQYNRALNDIVDKVKVLQTNIDMLDQAIDMAQDPEERDILLSRKRSKVYQKQYQESLKSQISGILEKLHADEYATIQSYLNGCYEDGYISAMYELQQQGIPVVTPIDQASAVRAVTLDSKLSKPLYTALGVDINKLKKQVAAEISRGIASSLSYADISRNLKSQAGIPKYNADRIVRTEGHRIQQQSADDARQAAINKGARLVKVWKAVHDDRTRRSHQHLDGEIRDYDEVFSNGLRFPGDPQGAAEEVINCRCRARSRAKGAMTPEEIERLKHRGDYFKSEAKTLDEFKKEYPSAVKSVETGGKIFDYIEWDAKREAQASKVYDKIRGADDIAAIASASGFSEKDISTIKNHIFFDEHILYDGAGRFAPSYDMAVAWNRLSNGKPEERDILLLQHELLENSLEKQYNLTASEAHAKAKEKYDWEKVLFDLFGEEGEPDGLL